MNDGCLGFKNLYTFNLGLLANQGWKLLSELSSLVSRTLKAKYFPHCSFLEAVIKPDASYGWKSICTARSVINLGSRWQIGKGDSVHIWND